MNELLNVIIKLFFTLAVVSGLIGAGYVFMQATMILGFFPTILLVALGYFVWGRVDAYFEETE